MLKKIKKIYILASNFFKTIQIVIYLFTLEIWKTRVKNRVFGTQYPFVFVWAGGECVVEKLVLQVRNRI